MDKRQLEDKVYGLAQRVKQGHRVEDTTIELKSQWPETSAAARRLAGAANAARGESVLWIVGIDEGTSAIVGADENELTNWLSSVKKHFEGGVAPHLALSVAVPIDGKNVVALWFDTDQSPYLVNNPSYGISGGGPVQYEVPWREGTGVRTAKRADLLRLLLKAAKLPRIEIRYAQMVHSHHADHKERWQLTVQFFAVPQNDDAVTFPAHLWSAEFYHVYTNTMIPLEMRTIEFFNSAEGSVDKDRVTFTRPIRFNMIGQTTFGYVTRSLPDVVKAQIVFGIAGEEDSVRVELEMGNQRVQDNKTITWEQGTDREATKYQSR
jgi:hypothetical protein